MVESSDRIHGPALAGVCDRVGVLSGAAHLSVKVLDGGLSNSSYHVVADGAEYVVRIVGRNGRAIGLDRAREVAAVGRAVDAGIAPEVIAFFRPEGHSVTRYLSGARSFTLAEFKASDTIRRVAHRLQDIHELPPIDGVFEPRDDIDRWLAIADEKGVKRPPRLDRLLSRVDKILGEPTSRRRGRDVLCHNDPYYLNFLDAGSLWLVDWEYAGMGDRMYDLAGVGSLLDTDGRNHLLECYFGSAEAPQRRELDRFIEVYVCWNVSWSLVQTLYSEIDFDYAGFAESLLDRVVV